MPKRSLASGLNSLACVMRQRRLPESCSILLTPRDLTKASCGLLIACSLTMLPHVLVFDGFGQLIVFPFRQEGGVVDT